VVGRHPLGPRSAAARGDGKRSTLGHAVAPQRLHRRLDPRIGHPPDGGKEKPLRHAPRHRGAEFQITFFIPYTVCIVGFVISAGVGRPAQQIVSGIGLAVFGLLAFLLFIGHTVFAIIGCVKSSRGEWWRYPINIRFVSGASTDEH